MLPILQTAQSTAGLSTAAEGTDRSGNSTQLRLGKGSAPEGSRQGAGPQGTAHSCMRSGALSPAAGRGSQEFVFYPKEAHPECCSPTDPKALCNACWFVHCEMRGSRLPIWGCHCTQLCLASRHAYHHQTHCCQQDLGWHKHF